MSSFCGNHLLKVFKDLHVDLRNLSPNVIKAWFDTDCKGTQDLLSWMCSSLSDKNYVFPLEAAEYFELDAVLDDCACLKELDKLGPEFHTLFETEVFSDKLELLTDEIEVLEKENESLEQLIGVFENLETKHSLDLTNTTSRNIKSEVRCTKTQEACVDLCEKLDSRNSKLRDILIKYDPDSHFVNFVNLKEYQENIDNLQSGLTPLLELDRLYLEQSEDDLTDALDRARKRILHSYQIYLVNKIEIDKLNEIFEFIIKMNVSDLLTSNVPTNQINTEAKELYKKRLCEVLDTMASNYAYYQISKTKVRYLNRELGGYQLKLETTSKLLEIVITFMSYYHLTNALQHNEIMDIGSISGFYQTLSDYINKDLEMCRYRIGQMDLVIDDYKAYQSTPNFNKMKLISALANVLSRECFDLKSALECVGKFRNEVNVLEQQIFANTFYEKREQVLKKMKDIQIMQSFLKSGPTEKIVLIPVELRQVWLEMESHLKKESESVAQAVKIPSITRKMLSKPQIYTKQLWMNFVTNPLKIDSILKQAEAEFNERTAKHFAGYADVNSKTFM